ncbi:glycan-binding surface protein [Chitinophagaceae bacterium LB-8]|uniref:Glycan-binding surface protein n=1 Tax=Paraflavisolibacter caeni TaxID=2982496 RepID=A0A9X2XPT1_9BACT|nr:glycan-binding surface protein [Paraflavisolibacter caeni]MCU7552118.1 glycan-binding surface protein [Paraflavisolibacter caeni]
MKKILNHRLYLSLFIMIVALLSACKKTVEMPPVISEIRSYEASPNDTVLNSLEADGQWVVISGQNLQNAVQIKFNGVTASFNGTLFSQNSAVVQIPTIMFSSIDTTKLYTIEYTTTGGSTTFAFKLGPGAPIITAISDVFANPGDSVFLYGTDLVLVESLSYAGTSITSFKSNFDGTSLGFLMPAQQPTDHVLLTTKGGSVDFKIVATPTITGVSNENAAAGDSVYVYGTYLKGIQSFSFSGADITSFQSSADGSSVGFKMPSLSTSAPVSITTQFGTATTVYNVNTRSSNTGVLANIEWGNYFGWNWDGAGPSLAVNNAANNGGWIPVKTDFDGVLGSNSSMFVFMDKASMKAGDGNSGGWGNPYQFYMGENQWMPAANLSDPVGNWAIKFEISVARPWNGATLNLVSGFASNYIARYEPWQISASGTAAYSTKGWQTVTIPLSSFRAADPTLGEGKGASVSSLANLIGSTGKTSLMIYLHNYGTAATKTGFYGAFDNVRVVKIK